VNDLIPYRKTYRVGDGSTSMAKPSEAFGEQPAERSYQPSLAEAFAQFNNAVAEFGEQLQAAVAQPLLDWYEQPDVQKLFEQLHKLSNSKEKDRQRSREDLRKKRREMFKNKGRL
jgi:hypothetical protein